MRYAIILPALAAAALAQSGTVSFTLAQYLSNHCISSNAVSLCPSPLLSSCHVLTLTLFRPGQPRNERPRRCDRPASPRHHPASSHHHSARGCNYSASRCHISTSSCCRPSRRKLYLCVSTRHSAHSLSWQRFFQHQWDGQLGEP